MIRVQLIRMLIISVLQRIIVLAVTHPLAPTAKLQKPVLATYEAAFDFVTKER